MDGHRSQFQVRLREEDCGCGPHSVLRSRCSLFHGLGSCTFPKVIRLLVTKDKVQGRGHRGPRFLCPSVQNQQTRLSCNPLLGRAWCLSSHPFLCRTTYVSPLLNYVVQFSVHMQLCIQLVRSPNFIHLSQFRIFDL